MATVPNTKEEREMSIYQIDENSTMEEIRQAGATLGESMGSQTLIDADIFDTVEDAIDTAKDDASEAFENFKCMSPFEMVASAINKRDDAENAWEDLEESFFEAYANAIDERKETIQDAINERRFEDDTQKVKAQWPAIKEMIVSQYGADDTIAISEGFNDWTDALCKDGEITEYTYNQITLDDVE